MPELLHLVESSDLPQLGYHNWSIPFYLAYKTMIHAFPLSQPVLYWPHPWYTGGNLVPVCQGPNMIYLWLASVPRLLLACIVLVSLSIQHQHWIAIHLFCVLYSQLCSILLGRKSHSIMCSLFFLVASTCLVNINILIKEKQCYNIVQGSS